jgi:AbrB family looped-hinge helix DNA binding protein
MTNVVGPKGQVVIEKEIRDQLNIQPGYLTVQKRVGDHLEIYFYPPEHTRSLRGILSAYTNVSVSSEEWPQAITEAWQDHTNESKSK